MGKAFSIRKFTETIHLAECRDGWWLYDYTQSMNLSMRAKTPEDAFVEALTYYQKRLKQMEDAYYGLKGQVDAFVSQFVETDETGEDL